MDNAAKWFLAGIFVSLVNTALVLFFIGIPGSNDNDDEVRLLETIVEALPVEQASGEAPLADAPGAAPAVTYVLVQDEDGNVIVERTELAELAAREIAATNTLGLAAPQFAEVTRPAFVAARSGVAWVTVRSRLELWRVDLEGRVESESLDGIEDLGESTVVDVDVTGDGALYLLVGDGTFEWRLFRRPAGAGWALMASSALSSWPAEVVAVTVADNGAVYLAARQPSGLFRLAPPFQQVSDWVPGIELSGIDTAADDSLQLYSAPQGAPEVAAEQVGYHRGRQFGVWPTEYAACEPASAREQADAAVPKFPRDVAIVDGDTALVMDSLNHVLRLQAEGGAGEVVFGVPCEQGDDQRHLLSPTAVATDEDGNVFITDTGNNRVVVLAVTTDEPVEAVAAVASVAGTLIEFGLPNACPGQACVAADRAEPAGARVVAGETVRFNINAISHQVAIYGPGARVGTIDTAIVGGLADSLGARRTIMDPNGRVAASPALPFESPPATTWEWDTTGETPGTYLVICTFQPHLDIGMYGWVIVE